MSQGHIDTPQLMALVGDSPQLLVRLGTVFLEQLPGWVSDFEQQLRASDGERLARLLHKMKGSCHAICASGVAREFASAELALTQALALQESRRSSVLEWNGQALVNRLHEIENEFRSIISQQPSSA
jgi:HPt (histidine-containing phosphotransfer) domain-containing protein